ncbi:MAG: alpha/beta fold hydrolase [Bacteroidetes bacterium]|nr:MAG: alpha/beta fold hydrolase [Bacteroidota bacterium]
MPLLTSRYPGPPFWQHNGHLQTLIPGAFRRVNGVAYQRERIPTPDDDFLDLDWIRNGHRRLVILTHGLEGNSDRSYIRGTAKLFQQHKWDVLAWNCRSCSGEMNRRFRMYHHGDIEDIGTVVQHALATGNYTAVSMVGFSMGANITLKYLGVLGDRVPAQVMAAAVFSAPVDLESGAVVLDRWDNRFYRWRFLRALEKKIRYKDRQFPGRLDTSRLRIVRRWRDFDEWFSAPICGYRDAADFYRQASAKHFIPGISIPTLLVNAWNDPILTNACMPESLARHHDCFFLEPTREGGHCGFMLRGDPYSWAERRALEFCMEQL